MKSIHTIDLLHLGFPGRIAAYLVIGSEGPILIETGPGSCHEALVAGLAAHGVEPSDVRDVFVTHIHLDHSGGAGWWARHGATVYVHEVGAPHLIDPEKLVASATRLYGDRMDELWGEILAAPEANVRVVTDGEVVEAGGLAVEALDTPGHASHHHVYRIGDVAFAGDLAAIVVEGTPIFELPTVPPEFSPERWEASIDRVLDLDLEAIYPTHFGRVDAVESHLPAVRRLLSEASATVRAMLENGATRDEVAKGYEAWDRQRLVAAGASEDQIEGIFDFNPLSVSLAGILRYWKKKADLVPRKDT
jgi:glyoxylase-like metal-dependent hydrolase (beta-lactamase superfamily II)